MITLISLAALSLTALGAPADTIDLITPDQAAQNLADTLPESVNGQPLAGDTTVPSVEPARNGFKVTGANASITIGDAATDPLAIATESGPLTLLPLDVSSSSTAGKAIGDNAVVYANTSKDADTAIKPTQDGIESFTNIRSPDAPENYSWTVQLPGDEQLKKLSDGTVVVVDPTPPIPGAQELPEPARPGTEVGKAALEQSGLPVLEPDPDAARRAEQAASEAGATAPSTAAAKETEPAKPSPDELAARSASQPTGGAVAAQLPPADALSEGAAAAASQAKRKAEEALADARSDGSAAASAASSDRSDLIDKPPAVVATIKAPQSVDSDGDTVATTLEVDGDTVSMHVDHQDASVSYPIAADPLVEIVVLDFRVAWYPILRAETYVSHWAQGSTYVGLWHPNSCLLGMTCSHVASGWYGVSYNSATYAAYWPTFNWGAVWQTFWYPVYATRLVVDQWIPYWQPYLSTEFVELGAHFTDAPEGDDSEFDEIDERSATSAAQEQEDEDVAEFEDELELAVDDRQPQARISGPVFQCFTTARIKQFTVYRPSPNPDQAGVRARGRSRCTGLPVTTAGVPKIQTYYTGVQVAGGTSCTSLYGALCQITSRYLASNRKRRFMTFVLTYVRFAPPNAKWKRSRDTSGISKKVCTGYGTSVLRCKYYRFFAMGKG